MHLSEQGGDYALYVTDARHNTSTFSEASRDIYFYNGTAEINDDNDGNDELVVC